MPSMNPPKKSIKKSILDQICNDFISEGLINLDNYPKERLKKEDLLKDKDINWNKIETHIKTLTPIVNFSRYEDFNIFLDLTRIELKKVDAIETYLQLIYSLDQDSQDGNIYYRGQGSLGRAPIPTIYRKTQWINNEHRLYREMIMYNPNHFLKEQTTFDILAKMQHYELPTRLLDVTTNPLVALYFACESVTSHGEVLLFDVLDEQVKYSDSDTVSVLANISKMKSPMDLSPLFEQVKDYCLESDLANCHSCDYRFESCKAIENLNKNPLIEYLLHEIKSEKGYFKSNIYPSHLNNYSVIVTPKQNNDRLARQSGAFLLFGMKQEKTKCADISPMLFREKSARKKKILRVIIPKDCKEDIMENLERINIHQGILFPELDRVATYLKFKKYR